MLQIIILYASKLNYTYREEGGKIILVPITLSNAKSMPQK